MWVTVKKRVDPLCKESPLLPLEVVKKHKAKKNGVTFSRSEVERLRGLKPHNMTEEAWLKRVAQEKQKIAQREAV